MRILFYTKFGREYRLYQATNRLRIVKQFPCDSIVCTSPNKAVRYIKAVDVILFDYMSYGVKFPKNYTSVFNDFPGLIGGFYGDVWTYRHHFPRDLRVDMHITSFFEPLVDKVPQLSFWHFVPACADVYKSSAARDIDILTWGAITTPYPFRMFCSGVLNNLVVGETSLPNAKGVDFYNIVINGKRYVYGQLSLDAARENGYYTSKLFNLLARTKISCTGAVFIHPPLRGIPKPVPWYLGCYGNVVVGKYFEHAAAGVVTITDEFSDMKYLGFQHQKNLWISNKGRFLNDLTYLLEHEDVCNNISKNARHLIKSRHTTAIRAREFYALLSDQLSRCREGLLSERV